MAKARFVSRYGNYGVGVQSLVKEHYGTGESKTLKRRIDANFYNNLVTDEDLALALQAFSFPGLPEDVDTNQNISPRYRISVWDSEWARLHEGWTDDEIDMIIARLRERAGEDHVEINVAAQLPFEKYDDLSIEEVLQILNLTGIKPEAVIAYERENQNRASLLKKLEGVEASDDAVVVSA